MNDISLSIHKIQRGDIFWECEGGQDAAFVATSDATRERNGIGVSGRELLSGKHQHFFEADRGGAYGPRLYTMPQYTRPDWPALLVGVAEIMRDEVSETEKRSAAREVGLNLAATQYSESRDHWQQETRKAQQEVARLQHILSMVDDIAAQKANGITISNRIRALLEAR